MIKNIPNILTIFRVILIPFIVNLIFAGEYLVAFILFSVSGITDILDGYIARKYNLITNFGKLLDPLADKLTQISTITALVIINAIPEWILLVAFLKEFTMIIGASFLYGKDVIVYSKWYGKLATVMFYLAIVISLLTNQFNFTLLIDNLDVILFIVASISTIYALLMYIKDIYEKGFINKHDIDKTVTISKHESRKRTSK